MNSEFKKVSMVIASAVTVVVALIFCAKMIHINNISEFQVIQSFSGDTTVRGDGGWYFQMFPKIWTYKKVNSVFFSNDAKESKDRDGIEVTFSNKGLGDISSQVVYRLYTDNEKIMKMHQYAAGDIDIVDNLVLSKLKDIAMLHASNITSSQAVEDREQLAVNIRKDIVNNQQLADMGIVVEQFSITKINFDDKTKASLPNSRKQICRKRLLKPKNKN